MQKWKKIGEILVSKGVLSDKTADRVQKISKRHKKRLGWTLEKLGLATGDEVAEALSIQYNLEMVSNLTDYPCPEEALQAVSCETAIRNLVFPLTLEGGNLLLAVADPTNVKVIDEIAAGLSLNVSLCVAARDEIYGAICKKYLKRDVSPPRTDTVLVVGDDAISNETVKYALSRENYTVLVANDFLQGFILTVSRQPHVILTDKDMPESVGSDMLEATQSIPEFESIPILLMCDKLSTLEERQVFDAGYFDVLPKPLNMTTLLSRVKRAFSFSKQKYGFF